MGWLVFGIVIGLAVGAAAVAAIVRAAGRAIGTTPRSVLGLIVDGLRPAGERDGVAAQRVLARRLKRTGSRTASGKRVAASELTVHVSPEDYIAIDAALGVTAAEADLGAFYRAHAASAGWIRADDPRVRLVRDISLRPRQAFVQAVTVAPEAAPAPPVAEPEPVRSEPVHVTPDREPFRPVVVPRQDEATTDVLPHAMLADAMATAAYPVGLLLGDLVAVHGTDVRTVPAHTGVFRIGRGRQNDLVVTSPGVGRDHLVIEVRGDAWWIVPGTAEATTMLDGRPLIAPVVLRTPAVLDLGRGARVRLSISGP